jgi:hypothetical protein
MRDIAKSSENRFTPEQPADIDNNYLKGKNARLENNRYNILTKQSQESIL